MELTLGQAGKGQANIVEDIVRWLSTKFQHQANMTNSVPPEYLKPPITTGIAEILQQVIYQNQDLMQILSTNSV